MWTAKQGDVAVSQLFFNGVDGSNGRYAFAKRAPMAFRDDIVASARRGRLGGDRPPPAAPKGLQVPWTASLLKAVFSESASSLDKAPDAYEPLAEPDYNRLDRAGWAVVFPAHGGGELKRQLAPLLELRRRQAGDLYREFTMPNGLTSLAFLRQVDAWLGGVRPQVLPYYILIVGDPDWFPFRTQYTIDVRYAVGRLSFDQPEAYRRYAETVVRHHRREQASVRCSFFGPRHVGDDATALSSRILVRDLGRRLANRFSPTDVLLKKFVAENAGKGTLKKLMGGSATPDMLLCAAHSLVFAASSERLQRDQGAIVCQEAPSPRAPAGKISARHVFGARDVADDAAFGGMLAFLMGCFSGGTPRFSSFPPQPGQERRRHAQQPFVAALPQRMLSVADGCRAVVAHVDNAYLWSFAGLDGGGQTELYENLYLRLLRGETLGHAMSAFNTTYSERLAQLNEYLAPEGGTPKPMNLELLTLWFSVNDVRNYIILGDPAVTLMEMSPASP